MKQCNPRLLGQALIVVPASQYPVSERYPPNPGQGLSNGVREECVAIT